MNTAASHQQPIFVGKKDTWTQMNPGPMLRPSNLTSNEWDGKFQAAAEKHKWDGPVGFFILGEVTVKEDLDGLHVIPSDKADYKFKVALMDGSTIKHEKVFFDSEPPKVKP